MVRAGPVLPRRLGALAGALGVVILRNPFYSRARAGAHLVALAVLFLLLHAEFLAAAQVVVYAGAVMVLYIFVVAYIGGSDEPLRPEGGAVAVFGPVFAAAVAVELCIAFIASGLDALDTTGADVGAGLRLARGDRPAAADEVPRAVRGGVLPAARGGGGRGGAGAPAPGAGLEDAEPTGSEPEAMDITWYLVLSAFIFAIGAAGVMSRRNPLVVLLCLELMLNAGNLALIAFSRMHGGEAGQVFALIVMVIAACEVVIGLGIIVAMYRRQLPIDVDEMSELRG